MPRWKVKACSRKEQIMIPPHLQQTINHSRISADDTATKIGFFVGRTLLFFYAGRHGQ